MSKQVDERVVSMQFDNKHFESNVKTTLGTLDKLKQSLNFTGAVKGLDNIGTATKNINMAGLGSAVQTVQAKFSALGVMGVTALTNITNSAVNAGKRIVSALTIDPVRTGFNEYELKMGAIQTIMASTGESLDTVNQKLGELNEYSDQTIYSFQDMTSNIGKFTNAGVNLEDAVAAMKGISNEAAVSGANANEASRAMYNFAQALSAGYVKLIDWKSIENANMATVEFKNELIKTAVELGTVVKKGEDYVTTTTDANGAVSDAFNATKAFNESLSNQWMTSEVLITTLKRYADETTDIGSKASKAATEVKTLSQLFDTLKESAQSGWAQSWEIIVGDFNESKSLMTTLSEAIGGFLDKISDKRNNFLEGVFGSNWEKLYSQIDKAGISVDDFKDKVKSLAKKYKVDVDKMIKEGKSFEEVLDDLFNNKKLDKNILNEALKHFTVGSDEAAESTKNMTKTLEEYQGLVRRIIRGEFGDGEARIKALTEAGYDYATAQNMVNEELGSSVRLESELWDALKKGEGAIGENAEALAKLSDKQLKAKGYTEEQIKALRDLAEQAEKTGTPINELIDNITKPSGRELIFDTVKTVLEKISPIFKSIKDAWNETFTGMDSNGMYSALESINGWASSLEVTADTVEQITRIAKGVMAFTKIFTSFGTKLSIVAFDVLKGIFGVTNYDILEMVASIGDAIVKLKEMIFHSKILDINLKAIGDAIVKVVSAISKWIHAFLDLPGVQKTLENIKKTIHDVTQGTLDFFVGLADGSITIESIFDNLSKSVNSFFDKLSEKFPKLSGVIETFKNVISEIVNFIKNGFGEFKNTEMYNIGKNVIEGVIQGLKDGSMSLGQAVLEIGQMIIDVICDVLGIHSPSTVGIYIGACLILGAILGLTDSYGKIYDCVSELTKGLVDRLSDLDFTPVWNTLSNFSSQVVERLKNIDMGTIMATAFGVGVFLFIKKLINIADKFTSSIGGFGKAASSMGKFFDTLSDSIKSRTWEKQATAVYNMAKAIAVLVASVAALTILYSKYGNDVWMAVGVVGTLAVIIGILATATKGLNTKEQFNVSSTVISIAAGILILAAAMKKFASIENMEGALQGLIATVTSLGILLLVLGKVFDNKAVSSDVAKAGTMLLLVSASLLVITSVIKRIAKMENDDIIKGVAVIAALELLFAALIAVSYFAGAHAAKAGGMLLMMSGALLIMTSVIAILGKMDPETVAKGMLAVIAMSKIFKSLIVVSRLAGKHAAKAGAMLLMMAFAFRVMVDVIKMASKLDGATVAKGLGVVVLVGVLFTALVAVSNLAGEHAAKAGFMLLTMATAMLVLVGVITLLGVMPADDLKRGLIAVSVLEILMIGLIAVTSLVKANEHLHKSLIVLVVAIGVLAVAVAALSFIKPDGLVPATAALVALIGVFSLLVYATSKMQSIKIGPLIAMLGVVAALAAIIWVLGALDVESSLTTAGALSLLLVAMSASLLILSKISKFDKSAMSSIGALAVLGLVVAELAVILGLMAHLNVEASMNNVMALSVLLVVMTGVLAAVSALGVFASLSFAAIGALALLGLVVGELAIILGLMDGLGVEASMTTAAALSLLLLSMSKALVLLTGVGAVAIPALAGVGVLVLTVTALAGLLSWFGQLNAENENMETFLDKGIPVLEKIGYALGSFFGNIIGGFAAGALSGLPAIGQSLSDFMTNAMPFIDGIKMVDESAMTGVKTLTTAILALTAADLISGIASFSPFASSFSELGTELSTFMANVLPFIAGASTITPQVAESVKAIATMILALTAADVLSGLTSWITGGSSLADFGSQLSGLGTGLKSFVTNLGTFGENELNTITYASNAIKAMAEAADALPNEGGWIAKILGDNSIATFGSKLPELATNLNAFATNLGTFDEAKLEAVTRASKAIKAMAEAADGIPNEGGWAAKIFGDNSIATFGSKLPELGTNLAGFATNLGTFNDDTVKTIKCASNAIKAMAQASEGIDGQSEWGKKLFGDNGLGAFSDDFPSLGTNLNSFVTNLGTFNEDQVATVNSVVKAVKAFTGLADANLKGATENLPAFSAEIPLFATNISSFCTNMPDGKSIKSAVTNMNKIIEMVNSIASADASGVEDFVESLQSIGTKGVNAFVTAFTNDVAQTNVKEAGESLINKVIEGAESVATTFVNSFKAIANSGVIAVNATYSFFYSAGGYLGDGLVLGIEAKEDDAYNAGYALGQAAAQGEHDGQESGSPSKLTIQEGKWFGEGLVIGIEKMASKVYNSGYDLGDTAVSSVSSAISQIANAIDSDIDAQPTIRPVLDLSDVESGAGAITSMLGVQPSVGVLSNIKSIGTMMDKRNQNGANSDVIAALKDLKKTIGSTSGNTYTINGITYDDGSNITEAVKALIRAANVERRV